MFNTVIQYIISPVLIAIVGYLIGRLKLNDEKQSARDKADIVLLRKMLKDYYETYKDKVAVDAIDYQNFVEGYNAYHKLGGNGVVTKMHEDLTSKVVEM